MLGVDAAHPEEDPRVERGRHADDLVDDVRAARARPLVEAVEVLLGARVLVDLGPDLDVVRRRFAHPRKATTARRSQHPPGPSHAEDEPAGPWCAAGRRWHRPGHAGVRADHRRMARRAAPASSPWPASRPSPCRASRPRSRGGMQTEICRRHRRLVRRAGGADGAHARRRTRGRARPRDRQPDRRATRPRPLRIELLQRPRAVVHAAPARTTTAATAPTRARPPATPPSSTTCSRPARQAPVVGRRELRASRAPRAAPPRTSITRAWSSGAASPTATAPCAARSSASSSHRLALLLDQHPAQDLARRRARDGAAKRTARMRL